MTRSAFILFFSVLGCTGDLAGSRPDDPGKADVFNDETDGSSVRICAPSVVPGTLACHARVATSAEGVVPYATAPKGLKPKDLQAAYEIDPKLGAGATIAIIDAYDDPS